MTTLVWAYLRLVSPEALNVSLNPLQGRDLVPVTKIRCTFLCYLDSTEGKSEGAKTIGDANVYDGCSLEYTVGNVERRQEMYTLSTLRETRLVPLNCAGKPTVFQYVNTC